MECLVESYKRRIRSFLNAEGTLIPCWARAHTETRKGWLRSETTAVAASTLIIMLEKNMPVAASVAIDTHPDSAGDTGSVQPPIRPDSSKQFNSEQTLVRLARTMQGHAEQAHHDHNKLLLEFLHMEGLMKDELEAYEKFTNEASRSPPIQWMMFRPPSRYHPDSFFNSLEDTPDLYRVPNICKISVPVSLRDYVRLPDEMNIARKEFKKCDIEKVVRMKSLFLFDITATGPDEDADGFIWQVKSFKYDDSDEEKRKTTAKRLSWFLYDSVSKICAVLNLFIFHPILTLSTSLSTGKYSIDFCKSTILLTA